MHENPQFLSAKGTTKKAEALELFVYPNLLQHKPKNTTKETLSHYRQHDDVAVVVPEQGGRGTGNAVVKKNRNALNNVALIQ